MNDACPCGAGAAYDACCGCYHGGLPAPTAEALMRSRYAAFVRRDAPYLLRTEHPSQRRRHDARALQRSFALGWCGLTIVATWQGAATDQTGEVHFSARYTVGGEERAHDERSRFVRVAGDWLYRDDRGTHVA